MNASTLVDSPPAIRNAPLALWRVAEAFMRAPPHVPALIGREGFDAITRAADQRKDSS